MDPEGLSAPGDSKVVKPITPEALAAFNAAQERTGIIYISRIPPGMRPTKVRHLMSAFGEVGRVYLQQEDAKRAYLRKKFTATKKAHFTEGWVEFADKKVARSVASMLNAQPIGGKKGSRWRDDVWTMKYLPRFKWNMLTEAIAHKSAERTARLRVELEHSRKEQKEYLHNVELARVLDKRAKRKRESGKTEDIAEEGESTVSLKKVKAQNSSNAERQNSDRRRKKGQEKGDADSEKTKHLQTVLSSIF
ncbi:hypothetical protein SCHPADRAFT_824187 [Schizopora paradoxa]|uniref:18S rRNA factor 2 n=1 Tax=Schizopora paradoxa TaxID=27342 RepID=A0A0H2RVT0_9AGAM|nr:hypothetical protein SCHPADRAFT_824187 [Schizopora paradoxa]